MIDINVVEHLEDSATPCTQIKTARGQATATITSAPGNSYRIT